MTRPSLAIRDNQTISPRGISQSRFARAARIILAITLLGLLAGCGASRIDSRHSLPTLFVPSPPPATDPAFTPVFSVSEAGEDFNRIGEPMVITGADGKPEIVVSPDRAVAYYTRSNFITATGSYHNLIYRIHFSEVPFGWGSFNLTAGKNPGLLFIYTFDSAYNLLLVTTLHSCGCYLAFLPTENLPHSAYPANWPDERQEIYGQTLPAKLPISANNQKQRIVFNLENETHRVADVATTVSLDNSGVELIPVEIRPISDLYLLPYQGEKISFFETSGTREGYVKNNTKWLERFFIGWWALDFRVGEDKAYGGPDSSEIPLYTSLKFWARNESNIKDFNTFLSYWGWKL